MKKILPRSRTRKVSQRNPKAKHAPARRRAGAAPRLAPAARRAKKSSPRAQHFREQAARYRLLFERASNPIAVYDREGVILMINQAGARNLGQPVRRMVGRSLREFLPSVFEFAVARYRDVIDRGESLVVEDHVVLPGGERWFWSTMEPVRNRAGRTYAVQVISYDITARKEVEQTMRTHEQRLSYALRTATDGFWDWDLQTNEVYYSPRWKEILGYADHEIANHLRSWESLVAEEDREHTLQAAADLVAGRSPKFEVTFRMRHKAGHWLDILSRGELVFDAAGRATRLIGSHVDITEQRRIERELRASEERYRAVVEDQTELICRLAPDGSVLFANEVFFRFFRKTSREVVGQKWQPHAVAEDLPAVEAKLAELSRDQPVVVVENRVYDGTGNIRWMQFVNRGFFDAAGRLQYLQAVGRDITERKHAETELRASEERLALALAAGGIGTFDWDILSNRTVWSHQKDQIYGLTGGGFGVSPNQQWEAMIHPEDRERVHALVEASLAERTGKATEFRIVQPDGTVRWVADRWNVICDDAGRPVRAVGVNIDITERRQAEERIRELNESLEQRVRERTAELMAANAALRDKEAQLRLSLSASQAGVWSWTPATGEVHWDQNTYELYGVLPGTPLSFELWLERVHPDDGPRLLAEVTRLNSPGEAGFWNQEFRVVHPEKGVRWLNGIGQLQRDASGQVMRFSGINLDITERKYAEESLRQSEAKYRRLHESMMDAFVAVDMQGRFTECNHVYEQMLGYSLEELRQLTYLDVTPEKWHAMESRLVLEDVIRTGHSGVYEKEYQRKDGTVFPVEVRTFLVRDEHGRPKAMWAIVRDITERKRVERARDESLMLLNNIIESSVDMIFVKDTALRTVLANSSFARAVGKSREELYGRTDIENGWLPELVYGNPDKGIRGFQADDLLALQGQVVRNAYDPANVGNEIRTFDTFKLPLRNADNQIIGVLAVSRDITDRIRAEKRSAALSELARKLNSATTTREAAKFILEVAEGLLGWDACFVELYAQPDNALVPVIMMDTVDGQKREFNFDPERLRMRARVPHPIQQPQIILRQPGSQEPENLNTFGDRSRRSASLLFAPIHAKGRVVGQISLQSYTFGAYSEATLETLQTLADYCGGAFERILAQQALRDSEARFTAFMDFIPAAAYIKDSQGRHLFVNRFLLESVGLPPSRWLGYRASEVFPGTLAENIERNDQVLLQNGKPQVYEEQILERGEVRTYLSSKFLIYQTEGSVSLGGVSFEITDQRRAEQERAQLLGQVQSARDRLEQLSRRLLEVQEGERRRLARELHDQVGQALTAIQIKLQTAARQAIAAATRAQLEDCLGMLDELVQLTQHISLNLRPSILDDLGLETALRWLTERQLATGQPRGEFQPAPLEGRLLPEIETACFRLAQEAITNIYRHARAQEFHVSLRRDGDWLELVIHDDGVGFDNAARAHSPERHKDLGLLGMEERVALVGGKLEIQSGANAGTTVKARFPLKWRPAESEMESI